MKQDGDATSNLVSQFKFILGLNCVCMTVKMFSESCRRFNQDSSTVNENLLEFSFDFGMSESDNKRVENGVDAHTQNRKN